MIPSSLVLLSIATISIAAPSDSNVALVGRAPCKQTFKTKSKETCYSLDERFKLVSGSIHKHNTFLNCADVWIGTDICVPNGPNLADVCKSTYRSRKGDTCGSLDLQFDLADGTIKGANVYLDCKSKWENSPICVPHGPRRTSPPTTPPTTTPKPDCKETYRSVAGDTCQSIEDKFGLAPGAVKAFNDFLTCTNVWSNTPICVPKGLKKTDCQSVHVSKKDDTCASLESTFTLPSDALKTANAFLDCSHIWTWTPLCIPIAAVTPNPNPNPTPNLPTCGANEAAHTTSVAGTTCDAVERELDLFPGALKQHTASLTCDNLPIGSFCVPAGPKMAATCSRVYSTVHGTTCNTIDMFVMPTGMDTATSNPLISCGDGGTSLTPGTRICVPAETCAGTAVKITAGKTCNDIESANDWFSWTLTTYFPEFTGSCNALPAAKLCVPATAPKMVNYCGSDPTFRTKTQGVISCHVFAPVIARLPLTEVIALNPFIPCTEAATEMIPSDSRLCIKAVARSD